MIAESLLESNFYALQQNHLVLKIKLVIHTTRQSHPDSKLYKYTGDVVMMGRCSDDVLHWLIDDSPQTKQK